MALMTEMSWSSAVLAMAPGSLTEMALTAKLMHADVQLVTAFHILRIFLILFATPFIFPNGALSALAPLAFSTCPERSEFVCRGISRPSSITANDGHIDNQILIAYAATSLNWLAGAYFESMGQQNALLSIFGAGADDCTVSAEENVGQIVLCIAESPACRPPSTLRAERSSSRKRSGRSRLFANSREYCLISPISMVMAVDGWPSAR